MAGPAMGRDLPKSYFSFAARALFRFGQTLRGVGAFFLIALGVTATKWNTAACVVRPLIRTQIFLAGIRLLPIIAFLGVALGFVIIGQTVSFLNRVGAQNYAGTVMVAVVVRELGPLLTALLVLARIGTPTVIELGMIRARGEVEALEAMGIDPIHYLVVPRVIGLALSTFALTIYLILIALFSGYLFAFLQEIPIQPSDYMGQIATALEWMDFVVLTLKTCFFGVVIATVSCYEGLAQPKRQEDVAGAATRAVVQSITLCIWLDALFLLSLLV